MNPDGISYLDLARNAAQGNWADTINPYWSPMYPWLIAGVMSVTNAAASWHFAIAHGTNFVLFATALAAFEYFLIQLELKGSSGNGAGHKAALRGELLLVFAYSAFAVAMLKWIGLVNVTPDLAVAAVVLICSGLTLAIIRHPESARLYWALGVALGAAYLTKGAMLPLAPTFLAPLIIRKPTRRRSAYVALAFAVMATPYILALSIKENEFTTGEVAKLNYAWFVNDVPVFRHWQGSPSSGTPIHPTRLLVENPATYEFVGPVRGTYPVWYDPSYWHEGVEISFDASEQWDRALAEAVQLRWMFGRLLLPLAALGVMAAIGGVRFHRIDAAVLLLPCIAAVAMYSLVHVEPRFLGGFLAVSLTVVATTVRAEGLRSLRIASGILAVAAAFYFATSFNGPAVRIDDTQADFSITGTNPHAVAAASLRQAGISSQQPIGYIGNSFRAYWAYVGNYRIGAETRPREFWSADPESRLKVIHAMRKAGIGVVVADARRGCLRTEGWIPVAKTRLCVLRAPS
jgi:hypothetical protein